MTAHELELERWRGETAARVADSERRLDTLNGNIAGLWQEVSRLRVCVARLTTRVTIASGLAALVGSGLVSFLVLRLA